MQDWSYIQNVRLVREDGKYWDYPDIKTCVTDCRHIISRIGENVRNSSTHLFGRWMVASKSRYVLRDHNGLIIPVWKIKEVAVEQQQWNDHHRAGRTGFDYAANYRSAPVPRTGKKHYHHVFRDVHTYQELKRLEDDQCEEYNIKIRRKNQDIPTSWDDIMRSDFRMKNWKKFRKTQYKA